MIYAINNRGLVVPDHHPAVQCNPDGVTTIAGPSGSGKSVLVDLVCIGLWGHTAAGAGPGDLRRSDAAVSSVAVGTVDDAGRRWITEVRWVGPPSRTVITRTVRSRADDRSLGSPSTAPSVSPTKTGIDRLILAPMLWREHGDGAGAARDFRAVLAQVAGVADPRSIVADAVIEAGYTLHDRESIDEKAWKETVRDARAAANVASGARAALEAEASVQLAAPVEPDADRVAAAEAIMQAAAEWKAVDDTTRGRQPAAWTEERNGDLAAAKRVAAETKAARIEAEKTAQAAADAHRQAAAELSVMRTRAQAASSAKGRLQTVPCKGEVVGGIDCGQCALISDARVAVAQAPDIDAGKVLAAHVATLAAQMETTMAALDAAQTVEQQNANAVVGMQRERDAAERAPRTPAVVRPDPEDVTEARALVAEAIGYPAAIGAYRRAAESRAVRIAMAIGVDDAASATVIRAEAILAAVRTGPMRIADALQSAIGDAMRAAGHDIQFGSGSTARDPAVRVLPVCREWSTASTGERIAADAHLRSAIRSAAARNISASYARIPVIIDEVQSCTLPLPEAGPVWHLRTQ